MPRLLNLICLFVLAQTSALAQPVWPAKPIHLVVPFAAGTAPDTIGRLLAQSLSESLAVPVVVENVPGAGGTIGVDRVAKARGDGYLLVLSGDAAIVVGSGYGMRPPYDAAKDLLPISQIATTPNIVLVSNELPVKTLKEFVDLARSQPGRFSYASAGIGTSSHRGGELLNSLAGLDLVHVPSSGSPLPDIMAGRVQLFFANAASLSLVREGKVRALAVSSSERLAGAPDLPTVAESGYPGFESVAWFGLFAPRGTPPEIVARLETEARKAIAQPINNARLTDMGAIAKGTSASGFARLIDSEIAKWSAPPLR